MRILMVIGQFRPVIGGAERQCELLARALATRGHAVTVCTVRSERRVPVRECGDGIIVERVAYPIARVRGVRIGFGIFAPFLLGWRVWRRARAHDVVLIHQALWPAFVASVAARLRGKPIMVKLGNSGERFDLDVLRRTHWYGAYAVRFLLHHVTRFVATSSAVRDDLRRAGVAPERMADIPNGVVLPSVPIARSAGDTLRAVFIGTLTPKKNVAVLLAATARLPSVDRMRTVLTIVGDGSERTALEQQAAALGVTDRVTFRGMVADPTPMLVDSDILVLPSRTEGLSNAALEAMAHGRALLVSNAGGNPDLVPDAKPEVGQPFARGGTGILVDPESPDAVAAGLQWFLAHPEERCQMGARGRVLIGEQFTMDHVATVYETLLRVVTKRRVVHLITSIDSQTGGMERQAIQLGHALRSMGHEIFYITSAYVHTMRRERLPFAGDRWGFRVYRLPFIRGWPRWNAAIYFLGSIILLVMLRKRYDIIHAHQLHTSGLVASVVRCFLRSKRVVCKNTTGGEYGDVGSIIRLLHGRCTGLLRSGIDQFVGVSGETTAEMRAIACTPIAQIPNGVRTDSFVPPGYTERCNARRAILGQCDDAVRLVLSVGRLSAQKNLHTILGAFAALEDVHALLLLVGDGPERATLERYCVECGIARRVRFMGAVADVLPYYHAADVFALPSRSEGMPNVVLEAMACQLPIVASDIPPIRELIRCGIDGILVNADDVQGFAQAIREVLGNANRARSMAEHARARAVAEYGFDGVAKRYAVLYRTLGVE